MSKQNGSKSVPCDNCDKGIAILYCKNDAAFLCPKCDKKIHATNKVAQKHHRIPLEKCQWGPDGKLIDPDSQMDLMITPSINMSKGSPAGPSSWIDAGLDLDSSMSMLPGFGDDFGTGKLNMPSLWATSQDVPSTEFHDANMRDGRMQDDSVPIKAEAPYLPSSNQMGTGAAMPRTGAQNQSGSPFGVQQRTANSNSSKSKKAPPAMPGITRPGDKLSGIPHRSKAKSKSPPTSTTTPSTQFTSGGNGTSTASGVTSKAPTASKPTAAPKCHVPIRSSKPGIFTQKKGFPDHTVSAHRQARLIRYRQKRQQRQLAAISGCKKIRYECRKTLADSRPRIKGRFAKVHTTPNDQTKPEPKGNSKGLGKSTAQPEPNPFARSCSMINLNDYEEIIAFKEEDNSDVLLERPLDPGDDASSALTQWFLDDELDTVAELREPFGNSFGGGSFRRVVSEPNLSQFI